jgi:hypothetical protein
MQMLGFVALTDDATLDKLTDAPKGMWAVEGCPLAMNNFLHTFMAALMSMRQQLVPQRRCIMNKNLALEQHESIGLSPSFLCCSCSNLCLDVKHLLVCESFHFQHIKKLESWKGNLSEQRVVFITTRQGICCSIHLAGSVHHLEVIAK